MLFRYRARNYPNTLTAVEWEKWRAFCVEKLTQTNNGSNSLLNDYFVRIQRFEGQGADSKITKALLDYANDKMRQLDITI